MYDNAEGNRGTEQRMTQQWSYGEIGDIHIHSKRKTRSWSLQLKYQWQVSIQNNFESKNSSYCDSDVIFKPHTAIT